MSDFSIPVPAWNDIPQIKCNGRASCNDSNQVIVPLEDGQLTISMYTSGFRIQTGKNRKDEYGMLK